VKTPLTALTLLGVMATSPAYAQTGSPAVSGAATRNGIFSGRGAAAKAAPKKDAGVTPARQIFPNASSMPDLTAPDDLKTTMDLPSDPIEPWLLTKEAGPFMVSAKTFRGVDADRMALALAKELRNKHGLPAYILRTKDFPGKSRIRGLPPTSDPQVAQASTAVPEKYRTFDEAAVLVGDCKTEKESLELLHKVKKIKPDCLNEMAKIFTWREGLSHAIRTANPYVAAQHLYPKKQDKLILQMNDSPLSVANCPGRYTLQIAMFSGRATFNEKDEQFQGILNPRRARWRPRPTTPRSSPPSSPRTLSSASWACRSTSITIGLRAGSSWVRSMHRTTPPLASCVTRCSTWRSRWSSWTRRSPPPRSTP
jgi:hypothetical protein